MVKIFLKDRWFPFGGKDKFLACISKIKYKSIPSDGILDFEYISSKKGKITLDDIHMNIAHFNPILHNEIRPHFTHSIEVTTLRHQNAIFPYVNRGFKMFGKHLKICYWGPKPIKLEGYTWFEHYVRAWVPHYHYVLDTRVMVSDGSKVPLLDVYQRSYLISAMKARRKGRFYFPIISPESQFLLLTQQTKQMCYGFVKWLNDGADIVHLSELFFMGMRRLRYRELIISTFEGLGYTVDERGGVPESSIRAIDLL
jgi:hypothetical protein